jgi:hypothetical protein
MFLCIFYNIDDVELYKNIKPLLVFDGLFAV